MPSTSQPEPAMHVDVKREGLHLAVGVLPASPPLLDVYIVVLVYQVLYNLNCVWTRLGSDLRFAP